MPKPINQNVDKRSALSAIARAEEKKGAKLTRSETDKILSAWGLASYGARKKKSIRSITPLE